MYSRTDAYGIIQIIQVRLEFQATQGNMRCRMKDSQIYLEAINDNVIFLTKCHNFLLLS